MCYFVYVTVYLCNSVAIYLLVRLIVRLSYCSLSAYVCKMCPQQGSLSSDYKTAAAGLKTIFLRLHDSPPENAADITPIKMAAGFTLLGLLQGSPC
jgi:hypothetical protein